MPRKFPSITFTNSVKAAQARYHSRANGARFEQSEADDGHLGPAETEFLQERDGFYLATVNEDGWPYVQFRGGPPGFVKVLDSTTLAYADFRGNRQYISTGNVFANDRVSLFFMDYATQRRLKVLSRATVVDAEEDAGLLAAVALGDYKATVERVVRLEVVAFDWNCPQHITPRFTLAEVREMEL
ncbi:MAG: putative pyridoxine 5'-phosphate oxidase superfamily flavin-nucleotide-binding protein [Planctomycetota bacterium]|jgi:predicted pyridoxine 5'-phosphate oxidase superfamily flavin-nucleotide-binding protein